MEEAGAKIHSLRGDEWEEALTVAIRWVKKDLPKVKTATLEQATGKLRELMNEMAQPRNKEAQAPDQADADRMEPEHTEPEQALRGDEPPAKHPKQDQLGGRGAPEQVTEQVTEQAPERTWDDSWERDSLSDLMVASPGEVKFDPELGPGLSPVT